MTAPQEIRVEHNPQAQRFECTVDGLLCSADYRLSEDVMVIYHTGVPQALAGRGIAAKLVRAAFDHARAAGLKIVPRCSYVQAWLQRNPDEHERVITP